MVPSPLDPHDTVLHEVGHVIDIETRRLDPAVLSFPSRALGEALADVISDAPSRTPCHIPNSLVPGGCERRLDVPTTEGSDPYASGQPVRFAAWNALMADGFAEAGRRVLDARQRVVSTARVFANDIVFGRTATPAESAELDAV